MVPMETKRPTEIQILDTEPEQLRNVYIGRMERLLRLRSEHAEELNGQGLRLLDRAIFAAYCACREGGAEDRARIILREANVTLQEPVGQLELPHTGNLPRTGTDG